MIKHYDPNYLEATYELAREIKQMSFKSFQNLAGGVIVELGCGVGADAISIAQASSCNVIGIDHDPQMLHIAQGKMKGLSLNNLKFELAEADNIPIKNKSAVGFRAERIFQHLSDQRSVLHEIHRCLTDKGYLMILETDWMGITIKSDYPDLSERLKHFLAKSKVINGSACRSLLSDLLDTGFRLNSTKKHSIKIDKLADANVYLKIEKIIDEMNGLNFFSDQEKLNLISSLKDQEATGSFEILIEVIVFEATKD